MHRDRGRAWFFLVALIGAGCSAVESSNSTQEDATTGDDRADVGDATDETGMLGDDFEIGTVWTNGFDKGPTGGFSRSLGTNGRTCNTCHVRSQAWTITPEYVRGLRRN